MTEWSADPPTPILAVPNVTKYGVLITTVPYNGPIIEGIKWLMITHTAGRAIPDVNFRGAWSLGPSVEFTSTRIWHSDMPSPWHQIRLNKKLSCRRETARYFMPLNILLNQSLRSFEMTPLSRMCPY